ncbi:MAG: hypothetical protein AB7V58_07950 [Solirubrobacterales bacterium]
MSNSNAGSVASNPVRAGVILMGVIALLALVGLSAASRASAVSWETVKNFGPLKVPQSPSELDEDVQLGGASGMAVNLTGNGGVEPGTVYTVGTGVKVPWHVARFSPEGDFELAWTSEVRCGPEAEPASICPTFPTGVGGGVDVAVNQITGDVYVFVTNRAKTISVYNADGTGPITQFAEFEASGTATSSPGKVHGTNFTENIAVDNGGNVYVYDVDLSTDQFQRLMVFKPCTPGNFETYCYAGKAMDIGGGFPPGSAAGRPMVDDEGDVYVSDEDTIQKFDPSQPSTPICTYTAPKGGITATTVNPETGAVFYYSYKPEPVVHQLAPCNGEGKFVEAGPPISLTPPRGFIEGMTFNPDAQFPEEGEPKHEAGILYAAASSACPLVGSCSKQQQEQTSQGYMVAQSIAGHPPIVQSESVTNLGAASATLNAQVIPNGSLTRYAFQYVSEASYILTGFAGANVVPPGGAVLGSGLQPLLASATLTGLSPATAYRYRIIATNEADSAFGDAGRFQTFPPEVGGLPDGRAWELVSPSQKNGGEVLPGEPLSASCGPECKPGSAAKRFPVQVAPSGDGVSYQGQPFSLNQGAPEYDEYVATRTPSGWNTSSMSPPLVGVPPVGTEFEALAFDSALSRGLTYATNQSLVPSAPAGYRNLFSEPVGNRFDLAPLLTVVPPNRLPTGGEPFRMRYVGSSADLSRVFFEANDALTGGTAFAPPAVDGGAGKNNLYEWHGGQLELVNVLPSNSESSPGSAFGSGLLLKTPATPVPNYSNAIAANGAVVFWSSESGQVYIRENGERTREIPDPVGKFLTAAADGSRVLLSDGILYDLKTGLPTDLTAGNGGFQGMVGQSDDLSSVYFVATSVVTGAANGYGVTAQTGQNNLYSWHDGAISFVGRLVPEDLDRYGVWSATPVQRAAEASPSGRWLAFNSRANLTGANTQGPCEKFDLVLKRWVGTVSCEEVYLYDSLSGALRCVSCNPGGATPLGGSFLRVMGNANRGFGSLDQPRYLTNSGRLYFDTRDRLSNLDTNDQVEDVYQYEPVGVGSCGLPGGCVSLLTSGRGAYDSNFLAVDPSGDNVFFTTRQRLVPRDQDELIDLYDARVGGGLASDYAVPPTECLGEGCQPLPAPPPSEPSSGSTTFDGPGNLKPKKAKKKHHKKKHKKHHKKKHKKKNKKGKKKNKNGSKAKGGKAKNARGGSK